MSVGERVYFAHDLECGVNRGMDCSCPAAGMVLVDLASPEAQRALAEALRLHGARADGIEAYDDTARAILAAWRETLR